MRLPGLISLLAILLSSCIEQLVYTIDRPDELPAVVFGRITDEPGPYEVVINRSFDVQSKTDIKLPVSAKHVNIIDELGTNEELTEVEDGIYRTDPNGIRGRVGGIYRLHVEFENGSVFESEPDTLLAPGVIDSLYHEFTWATNYSVFTLHNWTARNGFDIKVNSHGNSQKGSHYKWDMTGTFEAVTLPVLQALYNQECWSIPLEGIPCNFMLPCTGLRNAVYAHPSVGPIDPDNPAFRRVSPCECCKCWYKFFSDYPLISSELVTPDAAFKGVLIHRIPLVDWVFMFKVHLDVTQSTISQGSYNIFNNVLKQKQSISSLFQPINGHIPTNFTQLDGPTTPIRGMFYTAGISRTKMWLTPDDVPPGLPIPKVDFSIKNNGWISCFLLFPNATNVKPDFWVE